MSVSSEVSSTQSRANEKAKGRKQEDITHSPPPQALAPASFSVFSSLPSVLLRAAPRHPHPHPHPPP